MVIVAVGLAILPEIVRRVAVDQAPKLTGRVLALDDVDLNLFTGHLALKGGRIFKAGVNERAYEFERLDVRIDYLPFLFHKVRVTEISLVGAKLTVLRRGPTEFDFSDVLERLKGQKAAAPKESASTPWTVELQRISLQRDARMQELQARQLEAVRATLSSAQGIPAGRLVPGSARAAADAEGRVELTITN